jgi:transposase
MHRYNQAVKADVRRRMSPPDQQSTTQISEETGIHVTTICRWRKKWRLEGQVVPATENNPNRWDSSDKFSAVLETAGFNDTELSIYCRERGLYPEQVAHWRQLAHDANEKPSLTMTQQRDLDRRHHQDLREIKKLKQELRRKEKALAEAAALLVLRKKWEAFCSEEEVD